ncbi:peptidoglycan-associated lipoprotein Pal [Aidingimonas halophila]|uniref:Peptidoglycan-associated lipoprotein n=1 Tax=Aidingimonas halophila TaxID=574349 RepID=A0A1H3BPI1_9GAMM|nr:peptidoglycan-associated lipoprotein Pal [Aidingimonas halophila]GHC26932.1 peptidoglycan-associated lipoprotein [Aidingimonas halophila]SDX43900.1 peptidoglycan-associated lipoprotein [Aidingimonas halophila]
MELKPYAKHLAAVIALAVLAGCSSTGGTQDGDMETEGADSGRDSASAQGASSADQQSGTGTGSGMDGADADGIPDTRTIYFEFDSDRIRSEFESVLNDHAEYLQSNGNAEVVLQGHTDERGTREYNMALSERRAKAVERYLNVQGVSSSKIDIVAYGEERPAADGSDEESYAKNRRVVFSY